MRATENEYYLDLHGETREKAIRKLTSFLDQLRHRFQNKKDKLLATIITGSGSHSSNGPILRTAIEKTLQRRQMTYHLTCKKGAFSVDVMSGIEFYNEPIQDTKVLVVQNEEFSLLNRGSNPPPFRQHPSGIVANATSELSNLENPLPSQVAADDAKLSKAKEISLKEAALETSKQEKELNELNKAIGISVQSQMKHKAEEMQSMEEMMEMVMKMSESSKKEEEIRMEQELKEILELSKKEAHSHSNDQQLEEDTLQYVMLLSQRQTTENQFQDEQYEDEQLQKALELSRAENAIK
jgi:hypothetical protein